MGAWDHLRLDQFQVAPGRALPGVQEGSNRFRAQNGFQGVGNADFSRVKALPTDITTDMAHRYLAAPKMQESAVPAFRQMAEETKQQYDFMTRPHAKGGMGMSVEITDSDPYTTKSGAPNSLAMMRDVHENGRIKALSTKTTGEHPFFTNDENDMFRAVHDVFGHAGTGRNFSADGEEAAYRSHRQMFSPLAREAMTTETRVQNSLNNLDGNSFDTQRVNIIPGAQAMNRGQYKRAMAPLGGQFGNFQ